MEVARPANGTGDFGR